MEIFLILCFAVFMAGIYIKAAYREGQREMKKKIIETIRTADYRITRETVLEALEQINEMD